MSTTKANKADDAMTAITASVIADIKAGIANPDGWTPGWTRGHSGMPHNVSTGKAYQGGNVLICLFLGAGFGYQGWATYKQWVDLGWQVAKGEKGTTLVKWNIIYRCTAEGCGNRGWKACPTPGHQSKRSIYPKAFTVFNADQVREVLTRDDDGKPTTTGTDPYRPIVEGTAPEPVTAAEEFFGAIGADVRNAPGRAFYSPSGDFISVPAIEDYHEGERYYATLAHEHIHWTGAESRLNRELSQQRDEYAFEELVAELGAAFTCGTLGLETELRTDHAQYLANWLEVLQNDEKALWKAAGLASKAHTFLAESNQAAVDIAA